MHDVAAVIDRLTTWSRPYRAWISASRSRTSRCRPSGPVVMSQYVSARARSGRSASNSAARVASSSRSRASFSAHEWYATSRHSRSPAPATSVDSGHRRADACRCPPGRGRTRCHAATRRRSTCPYPHRGLEPGSRPARRPPECAPTAGATPSPAGPWPARTPVDISHVPHDRHPGPTRI